MIRSREELKQCLDVERNIYYTNGNIHHILAKTKNYTIYKYIYYLRHEEYYKNVKKKLWGNILYIWCKRRKNILGQSLGFDIPANCFDVGLNIKHVGGVIINEKAKIGKNCKISGNLCIGGTREGTPIVADGCEFGYGVTVIGDVYIAKDCVIGAGAVVTKSFNKEKSIIVGVPAKRINLD